MLSLVHSSAEGELAEAKALKAKTDANKSAAAGGRVLPSWRSLGPRAGSIPTRQQCRGAGGGVGRQGRLGGFAVSGMTGLSAFRFQGPKS